MAGRLAITVLLLAGPAAWAAEDAAQRAQRCAGISDSLERLVCYDGVFRSGQGPGVGRQPGPAGSGGPSGQVGGPPPPDTGTASAATPGQTSPSAAAMPDSAFGAEQLRRSAHEDAPQEARSLSGTVAELRETRRNVFRITLENGQIWQQMDMDSLFHVEVGDTVEINRGRLGGYRMARKSRGGSGWVRVNRIK